MTAFRKSLLASVCGAAAAFAAPAAFAVTLDLNPGVANPGSGPALDTTCGANCLFSVVAAPEGTNPPQGALMQFTSDLVINSIPGSGGISTGHEVGSLLITQVNTAPVAGTVGSHDLTNQYNLYVTFDISGSGTWNGPNWSVTGPVSASIQLYGSPGGASGLNFTAATAGGPNTPPPNTPEYGVLTPGSADYSLATGFIESLFEHPASAGATGCLSLVGQSTGSCPGAGVAFQGTFDIVPGAGTVGNFFANLAGLSLDTTAASNNAGTGTETVGGGVTHFTLGVASGGCVGTGFHGNCGQGAGNLSFLLSPTTIPEPASLSILGGSLLGMGVLFRRRRNRKA